MIYACFQDRVSPRAFAAITEWLFDQPKCAARKNRYICNSQSVRQQTYTHFTKTTEPNLSTQPAMSMDGSVQ